MAAVFRFPPNNSCRLGALLRKRLKPSAANWPCSLPWTKRSPGLKGGSFNLKPARLDAVIGKFFIYDTPPNGEHPFVVIAPSRNRTGWYLCVNLTTKDEFSDTTCEVLQHEHPSLTSPVSAVFYRQARELPAPLIERLARERPRSDVDAALLLRIQTAPLKENSPLKADFQTAIRQYLKLQSP